MCVLTSVDVCCACKTFGSIKSSETAAEEYLKTLKLVS